MALETLIMDILSDHRPHSFEQVVRLVKQRQAEADEMLIKAAIWRLISQHDVEREAEIVRRPNTA